MPGMYSKRVSTVISTFEESSVSLSSSTSSARKSTNFRQLELSPFALKLNNDNPQWKSQTENIFKTPRNSLFAKDNQNTGIVWKQTRVTVDYNDLGKASSFSPAINGRERSAMYIPLQKSAQSGNVCKSKPGTVRKASTLKRAGKVRRSKHKSTNLTSEKVLLSDIAPIISATKKTNNRAKKKRAIKKLVEKNPVCSKRNSSENNVTLNSPIRSTRSNYSSLISEHIGNSAKGKQTRSATLSNFRKGGQKSNTSVASKVRKKDGLEHRIVFENNSTKNVSPNASSQLKTSGNVKTSNNSPIFEKTVKIARNKNKKRRQIKSRSSKKSHVTSRSSTKQISTFSSSKTLVHDKAAGKYLNSNDAFPVSLQVSRSNLFQDKAKATEVSQLRKSKIKKHVITNKTQKGSERQAGKKQRQKKVMGNSQIENSQTNKSSFEKSRKRRSFDPQTASPASLGITKSGLGVNYLDYSVVGVEILNIGGTNNLDKIRKSTTKAGNNTNRNVQITMSPKLKKSHRKLLGSPKLLSSAKYTLRSKRSHKLQPQNFSTGFRKDTGDVTVDDNLNNLKKSSQSGRGVRKETQLLHRKKQRKFTYLAKSGTKRSVLRSNKNSLSALKKNVAPSVSRGKKKKGAVNVRKTEFVSNLDVPIIMNKKHFSDAVDSSPRRRSRISNSPLLKKELKSSPPKKQKLYSHQNAINLTTKPGTRNKKHFESESNFQKRFYTSVQLEKLSLPSHVPRVSPKQSQKSMTPTTKRLPKILSNRKQIEMRHLKKNRKKVSTLNKQKSSSLSSTPTKNASSQSFVGVLTRSLKSESVSKKTSPRSAVVKQTTLSSPTRKGVTKLSTIKMQKKHLPSAKKKTSVALRLTKSSSATTKSIFGLSHNIGETKFGQKENTDSLPTAHSTKSDSLLYYQRSRDSTRKNKSALKSAVKNEKTSHSKLLVKNNSPESSSSLKVGKHLTLVPTKILENKFRALRKRPMKDTTKMSPSKRTRMSDSPEPKNKLKPSIARKHKSLHIVKTAAKQSVTRKRTNENQMSLAPKYLSPKITNKSLQSEEQNLLSPRVTPKLSVAKKSQKPKSVMVLSNRKQTDLRQLRKGLKKVSEHTQRKSSSLYSSPTNNSSSQSFVNVLTRSLESSFYETEPWSPVEKSKRKVSSSPIRKGVNKLSTVTKQKRSLPPAKKKTSRLSKALRIKKSLSIATNIVIQQSPSSGVTILAQMEKSVTSPAIKRRLTLTTTGKKKKSHSNIFKVTPQKFVTRKKIKSNSEALSHKISTRPLRSTKNVLLNATEVTPKQSVSKLPKKSIKDSQTSTGKQIGKKSELFQLKKESKKVGVLRQKKSFSSSQSKRKTSSPSIARMNTKSVASESSPQVGTPASGAVTKNKAASSTRKGVNKLLTVTRQKNSLNPTKNKTSMITSNNVKRIRSLPSLTNKGTRPSFSSLERQFEHKKNIGLSKSNFSNKSISLSKKTSPKQSTRKNKDLISSKKKTLTHSNFLVKNSSPKTSNKLNIRKYQFSLPVITTQNNLGSGQKVKSTSPWNSQTAKLTHGKEFSIKKTSTKASKVEVRNSISPTPNRKRKSRTAQPENVNLFCKEDRNVFKPKLGRKQLQTITSSVSTSESSFTKKNNTTVLKSNQILQQKEGMKLAKFEARESQPLKPRRTRPSKAIDIKTSLVSPQQTQATKPFLGRKQLQKNRSSAIQARVGKRSERSIIVDPAGMANEISFKKTVKVFSSNKLVGSIQPNGRNNTSVSPGHLMNKYTNTGMASQLQICEGTKIASRYSDINNINQTKCTAGSTWKIAETSPVRSELIYSELGRKSLPSFHVADNDYSKQAKSIFGKWNIAKPSSSAELDVGSYTSHRRTNPSPVISRTESQAYNISTIRKDRTAPSLAEKTIPSLTPWTNDVRAAEHYETVPDLEVVASPASLSDDFTRYRINSPSSVETKSRSSSTLLDYTKRYGPDMKETSGRQSSFQSKHTVVTDFRNTELNSSKLITSSSDRKNVNFSDVDRKERFRFQPEHEEASNVGEKVEDSEELEEDSVEDVKEDDGYDGDTIESQSTQHCTIS